jgi:bifunctional ADP-heptose synthase (sugar kinase/adenylyltransferase)
MDTRTKIISSDRVSAELAALAGNGRPVVTAAGWFDVLQAAHGERLTAAKHDHARLVVFVYDDGPHRKGLIEASSRAQMVAALAVVDSVVICDEAEAASLAARSHLPPPLLIENAMPRDIVADVIHRHQPE